MKRQPTKWEKIFVNSMTDQGLISKIYKQLIQLNIKNIPNNPIKKWTEELNRPLFQRRQTDGQEAHEKCSTLLFFREIQIKTTVRYHLIPVRIGYHQKRTQITNVGKDVEKKEPLYTVGENVNWCSHGGKQSGVFSKN